MAEQASQLSKEVAHTTKPDIHFERAHHALTSAEANALYQRFLQGDKTAHGWNKEVTESMASYQPRYLALDGQKPLLTGRLSRFTNQNQLPLSDEDKQLLWFAVPGAPSEINKQSVVSVVAGDSKYSDLFPFFRDINEVVQDQQTIQAIEYASETLERDSSNDYFGNPKVNGLAQLLEMSVEDLAIALPVALGVKNIARRAMGYQPTKYNRREFFKRNIPRVIGAAALLSGFGGSTYGRYDLTTGEPIALSSNEQTREKLQAIAAIVRPRLERSIYVDGRTALLDAKLRVFMQGKQGAGAVVMGAFHDPYVMHTQADESDLIRAYAQDSLETIHELRDALKVRPNSAETRELDKGILAYLAKADVYTVSDPGEPTINPNLPTIVPKHVKYEGTFQCAQVEQAVRDLRLG